MAQYVERQEFLLTPTTNRAFVGDTFVRCLFEIEEGATVQFVHCAFLHCAFLPALGTNVSHPLWRGKMTNCTIQFDNAKSF